MPRFDMARHIQPVAQHQDQQPGLETEMNPKPRDMMEDYLAAHKLEGKKVVVTGGDSGIGRAIAIGCAKEGADVAIIYLNEDEDAVTTQSAIEAEGRDCALIQGDIGSEEFCRDAIARVLQELGGIDILVNNAGQQFVSKDFEQLDMRQMEHTFRTNIFSMFYLTQAALPHIPEGGSIINTTSITAYRGSEHLVDYASTKGAIVAFTRSLASQLAKRKIRVNAVAPGPIWTPLIPASFAPEDVEKFGKNTLLQRPGQPDEVAPCYIFLASEDASYITGQVMHPNGGSIVNT